MSKVTARFRSLLNDPIGQFSVNFGLITQADADHSFEFSLVGVEAPVQQVLLQAARASGDLIDQFDKVKDFEPAEKYGTEDPAVLKTDSEFAVVVKNIFEKLSGIATDPQALVRASKKSLLGYFTIIKPKNGDPIVGVKSTSRFPFIVGSHHPIIGLVKNALKLHKEKLFQIAGDFDLLADSKDIICLRPNALIKIGALDAYVLSQAEHYSKSIASELSFVDLEKITEYSKKHIRAARLLASISMRDDLRRMVKAKLDLYARTHRISITEVDGKFAPADGQELNFLKMLDYRLYSVDLTEDGPQLFEAESRQQRA